MLRSHKLLVLLLVAVCGARSGAQAQPAASGPAAPGVPAAAPGSPAPMRRLSVIFTTGGTSGGPGGDIEQAMHAAGLDYAGLFGNGYPHSESGDGLPAMVEAQYRIKQPWSVGVLYGRSMIGSTTGNGPNIGPIIRVNYAVTSVAAMLSAGPPFLQIGIGPALHRAKFSQGYPGEPQLQWSEHWKTGFIAQARAMMPTRSRAFLDLTVKYSYVGSVVVGPYSGTDWQGQVLTFPPTSVKYNHWLIGLGPGLRF